MDDRGWDRLLGEAWYAVAGAESRPGVLELTGPNPARLLPARLPVAETAVACVGSALLAAAQLSGQRRLGLHAGHVAAAMRSEHFLRIDGRALGSGFAPLSRFWRAADGWVRTHANYPWHRAALLSALEIPQARTHVTQSEALTAEVAAAVAEIPSHEIERCVVAAGGVAAALRTREEWLEHPAGKAVAEQPLIMDSVVDVGRPRERTGGPSPASGVRVLDLTRVIAGPVATRYLGALGADVLRIDPPQRPELRVHRYDGLLGKRSALLDAQTPEELTRLHELLDRADVLVHGYRPGALKRFGLDRVTLAQRHPGLVVVSLSAWGSRGPWGDRRGFDSIVQVATGIAAQETPRPSQDEQPGALPCQLLDHGTGYLCAAAALHGLHRQALVGGTHFRELSLARTAHWLLSQGTSESPPAATLDDVNEWLTNLPSQAGPITTVAPPGSLDQCPLNWPDLPVDYGKADTGWLTLQ